MILIISSDNKIVHQSENLRGIWEHTRRLRAKPEATITEQRDGSAQVYLRWPNADTCHHTWASALFAQERFAKAASRVTFHPYQERT